MLKYLIQILNKYYRNKLYIKIIPTIKSCHSRVGGNPAISGKNNWNYCRSPTYLLGAAVTKYASWGEKTPNFDEFELKINNSGFFITYRQFMIANKLPKSS
ncbi:hypothetical protein [[Phormidium] sp. ETS-05]|uniref:hypothetical protein n=1 Tax=[Phormidium] sp. ETS-05 TaxID=222819 RepID=UPI0018EF33CA|nr:hypothetical protein [[Phormidium] sp. ETS-05]